MADPLAPVELPSWPKCTDNLSWGEDHLAVASGEVIHILTPGSHVKASITDSNYWHIETVRVNQFSEQEWPIVSLAPISELSLGEEQSDSSICSLAWSRVGVGHHKRCVLAVLTSNLLLSLWESSGVPGSWKRISIVNSFIRTEVNETNRRKQRIRAFAWLPSLWLSDDRRQEEQYLVAVDDDDDVSIFHISKPNSVTGDSCKTTLVYTYQLPYDEITGGLDKVKVPTKGMSLLQRTLLASPVTRIVVGSWQKVLDETKQVKSLRIILGFDKGSARPPCPDLVLYCEPHQQGGKFHGEARKFQKYWNSAAAPELLAIETALAKPVSEFDQLFDLEGHVRLRHWGTAKSPDGSTTAGCITLHPSDMIEYNTPSCERCTIVFAPTSGTTAENTLTRTEGDPRLGPLHWLARHAGIDSIKTDLDVKLLRIASACIYSTFSDQSGLMAWSRAAAELASSSEVATDADNEGDALIEREPRIMPATAVEPCEICDAATSISQDLSSGRCSTGHTFARCGISFIAIQEPGISKYCSQCGREFLDISKLEPQEGPSLSLSLFEEFDVCPYCRGKFRGYVEC